ncbi:TetR/AcrR family transcriptional regulator [Motiliproteus sp. MSK22-1]|uniref:TetR/AcrR family transcriptional regulator n=1 Tax=Motiliproteus sp. MSK22-1 TaxID=1897630 RepID=UPI0013013F71|nr:TetR/AcrR family transcriptional regulator [Motiliproteus sp. MSK22-1]
MSQDTAKKILDASITLFAEHGFQETSLRDITGLAKVNLASVNYHFGSRKALVQAVAEHFLTPLCHDIESRISERMVDETTIHPEELFEMLVKSVLRAAGSRPQGVVLFMRLMGFAYLESQSDLRPFIIKQYGQTFKRFMCLLHASVPNVSEDEFFWRTHLMLGAAILPLSSHQALNEIESDAYDSQSSVEITLHRLVPFLVAGLSASADTVSEKVEKLL